MLKLRIVTALIVAPAILAAIFLLPTPALAILFLVLAALGAYEWARLAGLRGVSSIAAFVVALAAASLLLWQAPVVWGPLLMLVMTLWGGAVLVVITYPASGRLLRRIPMLLIGFALLLGTWLSLVMLAVGPAGAWSILWVFLIVWSADIGAYFAGRRFGTHKLAAQVSPGKTWEGVAGGVALAVVLGTVAGVELAPLAALGFDWCGWLVAAALLAAVSVFGDLFESVLKRVAGVKDSGVLFPGHGGMLDRIDSLLAALPCFAFVTQHLGWVPTGV